MIIPYRQAAELLGREIGEEVSHSTRPRWVEEEGKRLRREEEAKREGLSGRLYSSPGILEGR